jgi:hypothetical protein
MSIQSPTLSIDERTSIAESINHLVGLLLIIQIPRFFKCTRRICPPGIVPHTILRIFDTELETVKDEKKFNTQLLELLEFSLDIRSERKGETTEGN